MRRAPTGRLATSALFFFVLLFSTSSFAIDLGPDQPVIAVKWGRIGRGTAEISNGSTSDREVPAGPGSVIGAAFDFPLSRKLSAGIGLSWWLIDEGQWPSLTMGARKLDGMELSAHLKGLISFRNGRYAIRPGIGVGGLQGHYTVLTLQAGVELQASVSKRFGLGIESGVWCGPLGTDDEEDITIGPLGFLRVQLLFATGSRGQGNQHR
jgi:hypothetical protein